MKGAIDTGRLKPNTGRTNQKLYFAKLQTDQLKACVAAQSGFAWESEALALREAVILHLHGAYVAFLQELVRFYKLSEPAVTSEALRQLMQARGQVAPEITVLQQLEQNPQSWLAALWRAHSACLIAPDPVLPEAPQDESENPAALGRAIGLVTVSDDVPLSSADVQRLEGWHRELTAIIREFRAERVEF